MYLSLNAKIFGIPLIVASLLSSLPCAPAQSESSGQTEEIKLRHPNHRRGIARDLQEEVNLADQRLTAWYPVLGPKLGAHLTNPNIVLLLAGERGLSDVVFYNWSEDDVKTIAKFNEIAAKDGVRISYLSKEAKPGTTEVDGWFESLAGYERVSHNSKLSGILPYDASTGWNGLADWKAKVVDSMNALAKSGTYPNEVDKTIHPGSDPYFPTADNSSCLTAILRGVAYAYPDSAIYPNDKDAKYVFTKIPYADFHRAPEPNFSYSSKADFNDINKKVYRWATLWGEFYHSSEYLKLANDAEFKKARMIADCAGVKVSQKE